MLANLRTQRLFLRLVRQGVFCVPRSGYVVNMRTGKRYDRIGSAGYVAVSVKISGKKYSILTHRLMWLVHNGWLESHEQVNHINGVKHHNRLSNFEKTDNAGNTQHAYDTGLAKPSYGESSTNASLTNQQANNIRKYWRTGRYTKAELARFYGVSRTTIRAIIENRRYADV